MKIICIGKNYRKHAAEMGGKVPEKPLIFMKPPSAILHKDWPFYIPDFSKEVHYEAEIVLKICKNGKHIEQEFAHKYYQEVTIGLDMTARDLQANCKAAGHPWEISKAFDNSAILGNWISKDELVDDAIKFSLLKNGIQVQSGNTEDLVFKFDYLLSYISRFFKLQMGDLIFTGTPEGVGPVNPGDLLEGFIGERKLLTCNIK